MQLVIFTDEVQAEVPFQVKSFNFIVINRKKISSNIFIILLFPLYFSKSLIIQLKLSTWEFSKRVRMISDQLTVPRYVYSIYSVKNSWSDIIRTLFEKSPVPLGRVWCVLWRVHKPPKSRKGIQGFDLNHYFYVCTNTQQQLIYYAINICVPNSWYLSLRYLSWERAQRFFLIGFHAVSAVRTQILHRKLIVCPTTFTVSFHRYCEK